MPDPSSYNNQDDFISACISTRQEEHPEEDTDQSAAICFSMWKDKGAKNGIVHKTHVSEVSPDREFILSDETVDRYQDVISVKGWSLENFKKNPVAPFNHDSGFIVGKWKNVREENGALRGQLEMAPEGTSARIDEIRRLIDAGILKAVSVGFHPIESKPRSNSAPGTYYAKSELIECSLVGIPANPNALAIAKSLKVSDDTMKIVFGEHADNKTIVKRGVTNGKHAEKPKTVTKGVLTMSGPLAQRIVDTQERIVKLRDELNEHMKTVDDVNPTDEQTTITEELTTKIDAQEKSLKLLSEAEKKLAVKAADPVITRQDDSSLTIKNDRPFAVPVKKIAPVDYIFRALTVQIKHHGEHGRRSMAEVWRDTYGERDEGTLALMNVLTRAATAPATTTTSGWAQDLVTVAIGDFFGLLQPVSVYARLSAMGGRFTFGTSGIVTMPTRSSTPTVAGAFVAQGSPIPVKQAAFTSISLTPKKVGVISTMTREISEHSTPAIEQLIRDAIVEDTANTIDSTLLDATAASATRPAGLRAGVSTLGGVSGDATIVGVIADIKLLQTTLLTATNGNVRTPVWITTPAVANAIALATLSTAPMLPFREEVSRGTLMGWPIITSTNVTAGYLIVMDAADFVTATGDVPRFDVSDQAVLHFDDTTPLDITTTAVAATTKSLWQTDSIGIRMVMDINWGLRRTGMIYYFGNTIAWD